MKPRAKLKVIANSSVPTVHDDIKSFNRIKGQIEGIGQMLQKGRSIEDVIMQMGAVRAAIKSLEMRLLENRLRTSITDLDDHPEAKEAIKALLDVLEKR